MTTYDETRSGTSGATTGRTAEGATDTAERREGVDATPLYAVLGAGQVVADGARRLAGEVGRRRTQLAEQARTWNGGEPVGTSDVPRLAVGRALRVAGHVESAYGGLAERGRGVAGRLRDGRTGADVLRRAMAGLSRPRPERPTFARGTGAVVVGETVDPVVVVTDPVVDPVAGTVPDPVSRPGSDPLTDPLLDPAPGTEPTPAAGPLADPFVDPVVDPGATPIAEPVGVPDEDTPVDGRDLADGAAAPDGTGYMTGDVTGDATGTEADSRRDA